MDHALTIGAAARLSRVPAPRLRAWERAGLLEPARSPAGYRIYDKHDLQRIEFLKEQLKQAGRLGVHAMATGDAPHPRSGGGDPASDGAAVNGVGAAAPSPLAAQPQASPSVTRMALDALKWAQPSLRCHWCAIALPRAGDERLSVIAAVGQPSLVGYALSRTEAAAWEHFLDLFPRAVQDPPAVGNAVPTGAWPLVINGARGALILEADGDHGALEACAGAIGLMLEQATAAADADDHFRRWQRESAALHAIGATLSANPDLDAGLSLALEHILRVLDVEAGTIHLVDRAQREFVLAAHHNCSPEYVAGLSGWPVTEGIGGRAFLSKEPLIVSGLSDDPRITRDAVRHERLRAWACVPLVYKGEALGLIETMSVAEHSFSAEDIEFLRLVAEQIATVVAGEEVKARLAEAELERGRLMRGWSQHLTEELRRQAHRLTAVLDGAIVSHLDAALGRDPSEADDEVRNAIEGARAGAEVLREAINGDADAALLLHVLIEDGLSSMTVSLPGSLRVEVRAAHSRLTVHDTVKLYDLIRGIVLHALDDRNADLVELTVESSGSRVDMLFRLTWSLLQVIADDGAGVPAGIARRIEALGGRLERLTSPGVEELRVVIEGEGELTRDALTDRQSAVLRALARGLTRKQAAGALGISEKTVQNHLAAAYRRLGACSRTQAIANAMRAGVLGPQDLIATRDGEEQP